MSSDTHHNPRFLCDEMLQRLGRWLRAAGYDTLIASDSKPDYQLLLQAIADQRLLITRDRELSEHRRAPGHVIYLSADKLEDCARELSSMVSINWLHQPFSRCMKCNTPLIDATPQQVASMPKQTQQYHDKAYFCPTCRQVYWGGSHVKRMRRHLEKWQETFNKTTRRETPVPR